MHNDNTVRGGLDARNQHKTYEVAQNRMTGNSNSTSQSYLIEWDCIAQGA